MKDSAEQLHNVVFLLSRDMNMMEDCYVLYWMIWKGRGILLPM